MNRRQRSSGMNTLITVLAGLVGGVIAWFVAGWATTSILPASDAEMQLSDMLLTFAFAAGGGLLGVMTGWLIQGRRAKGLGGITAIVSFLGAVGGTLAWARQANESDPTGLYLVGAILMLGVGLIGLVAVNGMLAALLRHQSIEEEELAP
ncbi:hypothetical protein ACQBAT_02960 [Ornithinimicrobium sp. Y1847]|uniref:hypothetical protein n=1 Tax=unclassified Ornithinimicrobium TaxID=2615080 RepID=UPI003B67E62A